MNEMNLDEDEEDFIDLYSKGIPTDWLAMMFNLSEENIETLINLVEGIEDER